MRCIHWPPLRARHVWMFVLVSSVAVGSMPPGRGRYVLTLIVCVLGITGFCLTMKRSDPQQVPSSQRDGSSGSTVVRADDRSGLSSQLSRPRTPYPPMGESRAASVTSQTRLAQPVTTASMSDLVGLLGEQVTGGDGRGTQLWATPVDEDGLDVEFIDATGAHACLRLTVQGFVGDDVE